MNWVKEPTECKKKNLDFLTKKPKEKTQNHCLNCGKPVIHNRKRFCDLDCIAEYKEKECSLKK